MTDRSNLVGRVPPTPTDDVNKGYGVGSRWTDKTHNRKYTCTDATNRAAIWIEDYADVTDPASVGAAGAVMDSDFQKEEGFMRKTAVGMYEVIKSNMEASAAPATTDDSNSGYAVGSRWFDITNDKEYVCLDATYGAAVWIETTGAAAIVVRKNSGTNIGTRPRLNFIEGSNVTLAISDDSGSDEIDISIAATGGDSCYVLAATDTPTTVKNRADGTCSATSAETEINTAFATYDTVILTEGTFVVDGSITPGAGQSLIGSGPGTIIKIKDATNAYLEVVFIYNVANTLVSNITFDGNRANQTAGDMYGVVWYTATHAIISHCWFNNFRKDAMRARTDCKYGVVANCIFDNNDYGPSIESGSEYITVHDCVIRRSQYSGLYISSASNIALKNNIVLESSQITNNTWPDIKIEGGGGSDPVTDIDIQGNTIRAGGQANKSKYAIEVNNSNCTRILIANNDCYGAGVTGTFLDNGTSTNWGAGNRKKNGTWATGV